MRLQAAANSHNDTRCTDAYSNVYAFHAQLALYDDNKRDSESAERRIFSVAPNVTPPARRVVKAAGSTWIIGHAHPDTYHGLVIRIGLVAHEATNLSQVRTLTEACLNQSGFTAWAARAPVKNIAFTEQSSRLTPQSHLHFASTEPIAAGHLVSFAGKHLLVRTLTPGPSGTLIIVADELPEPTLEVAAVLTTGTYDPITDTTSAGTVTLRVVRVRWQSLFAYRNSYAPTFGPEDIQVAIAKSAATARPGQRLTLSDGSWQIHAVADEGALWLCRASRHV